MGLKLRLLGCWTPSFVIRRELANVFTQTTDALNALVDKYVPKNTGEPAKPQASGTVEEQRENMAQTHARLIEALEVAVGREKAVSLGRAAMFSVGENLGRQARSKLGVGDSPEDLTRAAKILYRILGIEFSIESLEKSGAIATINKCALAKRYSELTCEVMSATDEGVICGLQPKVGMNFREYMTSGCRNCKAVIRFNVKEEKA